LLVKVIFGDVSNFLVKQYHEDTTLYLCCVNFVTWGILNRCYDTSRLANGEQVLTGEVSYKMAGVTSRNVGNLTGYLVIAIIIERKLPSVGARPVARYATCWDLDCLDVAWFNIGGDVVVVAHRCYDVSSRTKLLLTKASPLRSFINGVAMSLPTTQTSGSHSRS
jgi:hypothetical protein